MQRTGGTGEWTWHRPNDAKIVFMSRQRHNKEKRSRMAHSPSQRNLTETRSTLHPQTSFHRLLEALATPKFERPVAQNST